MLNICRFDYNYAIVIDNRNVRVSSVLLCYPIQKMPGCIRSFRLGCTAFVHCIPNRTCAAYILHDAPCPCSIACFYSAPGKRTRSVYLFGAMQPRRLSGSRFNCQWWLKLRPSAEMTSWFRLSTRLVSLEYARPCHEPIGVRASSSAMTGIIHMTRSNWRSQFMPKGHGRSFHLQSFLFWHRWFKAPMGISQRILSYSSSSRSIRTEGYTLIHRTMSKLESFHALETTHPISQVITYHELF